MKYWAFFDVDETLICSKSMFSFLYFYLNKKYKDFPVIGKLRYLIHSKVIQLLAYFGVPREYINRFYYRIYRGERVQFLKNAGEEWFRVSKKEENSFFKSSVVAELKKHQVNGAGIVFVSGSFLPCLSPIASYFKVEYCLCTELGVKKDKYTGKLQAQPVIGRGKALAIKNFLENQNELETLRNHFAYGDHISDLPMLQIVGNPVVVSGDKRLESHASKSGWKIL